MNERQQHQQDLEQAVDQMDLTAINTLLDQLDALEQDFIQAEDPMLFAARIRKLHQERTRGMVKFFNKKVILVAACLVVVLSVGTYAASKWQTFSFFDGGRLVTVTTTDPSVTQAGAEKIMKDDMNTPKNDGNILIAEPPKEYPSIEAAASAMGMPVSAPENTLELKLSQILAQGTDWRKKNIYLTYGEEGRRIGVTVMVDEPKDGSTIISYSDIHGRNMGVYKNANGDSFHMIRDEKGDYAYISLEECIYVFIFEGCSDEEIHQVLDSTDFSVYQ